MPHVMDYLKSSNRTWRYTSPRRLPRDAGSSRSVYVTCTATSTVRRQQMETIRRHGNFRTARRSAINSSRSRVRQRLRARVMSVYLRSLASSNRWNDCRSGLRSSACTIKGHLPRRKSSRVTAYYSSYRNGARRRYKLRLYHRNWY